MQREEELGPFRAALRSSDPLPQGAGSPPLGLRLRVVDSGIGIAADKQERIFEPFFQVDSSSTREYGGTGLGLTLVKSYAEAHGGRVWVESELARGSSFTVTLPAVDEELARFVRAGKREPSTRDSSQNATENTSAAASGPKRSATNPPERP
jgi:hypothetical protein